MRKSELYDRCVFEINQKLVSGKFGNARYKSAGIALSNTESKDGPVSMCWGILFTDPDRSARCTQIHTSYYSESVALEKLLQEIQYISINVR
jgi:hypothetical protein